MALADVEDREYLGDAGNDGVSDGAKGETVLSCQAQTLIVNVERVGVISFLKALACDVRPTLDQRGTLHAKRKRWGISTEELAERLGNTASTIAQWEWCSLRPWARKMTAISYRNWVIALALCIQERREKARFMAWKRGIH